MSQSVLDSFLQGLDDLFANHGSGLSDLRYQLKVLQEERAGLYSFAPLKEGELTVLIRGCYGESTQGAYAGDPTLMTGATGIIRKLRWMPAKEDRPGEFCAYWEPTLKWGYYTTPTTSHNNSYVRSVGSTYHIGLDRLGSIQEPYPWVVACRTCSWTGPVPAPTEGTRNLDCPNCPGHYETGAGNYGTRLWVTNPPGTP